MSYIITQPCVDVKDAACVDVCPVDCIQSTDEHPMYFINPEECIDCAACEPVCPVAAIFAEEDVPEEWAAYTDVNYMAYGLTPPSGEPDAEQEEFIKSIIKDGLNV